jgi:hypothetical protein
MKQPKIILAAVILLLVVSDIFFCLKYFSVKTELAQKQSELSSQQTNSQVLVFATMFIEKILKADQEVDFETRLELENSVRNLNDQDILNQWQKFTAAQTQEKAQEEVKNLLGLLVSKIR